VRQNYSVSDFDSVRVEAPIDVVVTTGKGTTANATGDRDTLDSLDLQITNHSLSIRMRSGTTFGGNSGKARARAPTRLILTTNELRRAAVMGAGSLTVDRLKGDRIEAIVRGSGVLTIARADGDKADVGLLGAGSMTLGGAALDVVATVSGSGRVDASALNAHRLRIDTEGSVDVQAKASEEAIASANGTGRLVVTGSAKCTVRKVGSASITCGGEVY
jgi:hypothetical protein